MKEKLIVILGPTAVGKTALSIELAHRLHTEILSGDSMLVYRGLDIGTAKPSIEEQAGIVHHMIDILAPEDEFSVTKFRELAAAAIHQIHAKGRIPILAGGTGLYIKSLLEDYQFNRTPGDEQYRQQLEQLAVEKGKEYVHEMLAAVDPAAAERLHVNDFRRVIRALEVYHQGGEKISQEKRGCQEDELAYDAWVVGLDRPREQLYDRINQRVEQMFANGLVEEVKKLLQAGMPRDCQAMQGIGYKEVAAFLAGELSLEEAKLLIQKSTRHFAKRQLTWYRKMPYIHWYDVDALAQNDLLAAVYEDLAGKFAIK